ncbi:UNVERIFIED_CONTAM: putative pentatricopeptide repeat-containing protein, mitochondrial [Sesamum angustifolium]|uniref:Pentatricopeptide repeat-containing protein, mitochondrial n=1 Tax=Sesamum angustifolium TaxID=2727405 RepID=A0AAW2P0A4_9LAMI
MRKVSSLASRAAPEIQNLAERTNNTKKPTFPRPPKLKPAKTLGQNPVVSSTGKLQFNDTKFNSISACEKRFVSKPIDHRYLSEILLRKEWYLLLNLEFKAQRLILNTQTAVSILQNQENALCPLRFYVWLSNVSTSLARNQSILSALSNSLYRKGPVLLSAELIKDIRSSGCRVNEDFLCALIGSWGRLGLVKYCSEVFEQVSYLGIGPSTRLYNAVIDGLVKSNSLDLAYLKFQQMEVDNCARDRFTYNILIHGVCKAGVVDEALRLVKQMERLGYSPNVFTYTILIDGYCNAKRVDDAFRLLEKMKARNVRPNDATYRSLINGVFCSLPPNEAFESLLRWVNSKAIFLKWFMIVYCLCNNYLPKHAATFLRTADEQGLDLEETCRMFEFFINRGVKVDLSPCLALVEALYKLGREGEGNRYLSWMLQEGLVTNVFSYNMVIDCFCKANMMHRAIENLGVMSERGILPNLVTFNTLIAGYCKARDVLKAREMLLMLLDHGFKPDLFTFNSIIDGLCQVNQITDAFDCYLEMVEWGITPNAITYNSLIRSVCISGHVAKAMELLRKMQIDGIQPDLYTFNALIQKYCKINKIEKAKRILASMLKLDLRPDNSPTLLLLVHCASLGDFWKPKSYFLQWRQMDVCLMLMRAIHSLMP